MNKARLLIFFLFVMSYQNAYPLDSCQLTLRGKVLHDENNEPIAHAYIWIVELGQGAISDEKGNFRIDELCPGIYTVKVTYLGHQEEEKTMDLNRNTNITILVHIHSRGYSLEQTVLINTS